jgi:hypothetical protein
MIASRTAGQVVKRGECPTCCPLAEHALLGKMPFLTRNNQRLRYLLIQERRATELTGFLGPGHSSGCRPGA